MRLSGTGDILSVDDETFRRRRRDAAVAAVLGRGGHRGPGAEGSSTSSSGESSGAGSARSRSERGVEAASSSEATQVDAEDDLGLGLGPNPTIGEVERASRAIAAEEPAVSRASEFVNSQWLEERLESELQRQGAMVSPTLLAPAVGPAGEEVWPQDVAAPLSPGAHDAREDAEGDSEDSAGMSVATSEVGSQAAGPPNMGGAGAVSDPSFWAAVDQKIGDQISGVEHRLTTVLSTSLTDIAASQRDMMKHLAGLTKQVHDEAAYQRDVQREFSTRLDELTESAGGRAQATRGTPPTRRKERRTESSEAPRVAGTKGEAPRQAGLPVPSTPPRALRPGGAGGATPPKELPQPQGTRRESRGKGVGGVALGAEEAAENGGEAPAATDPLTAADPWARISPPTKARPPPRAAASSWEAFLASSSKRPGGLPAQAQDLGSQASASTARRQEGAVRRVVQAPRVHAQGPEPDLFLSRQAVIGPFGFRTRSSIAKEEVLQVLQDFQLSHLLDSFPGSAPTCENVIVRLVSFEAVQILVQALRSRPVRSSHSTGPLWAIRCRSAEERARSGPVARAVRILNDFRESRGCSWRVEGHYRRGQESVWVSKTSFATERWIISKDPVSEVWQIDEEVFADLGVGSLSEASEWLAALL